MPASFSGSESEAGLDSNPVHSHHGFTGCSSLKSFEICGSCEFRRHHSSLKTSKMNRLTHPRNSFKLQPPDFAELVNKYTDLKEHAVLKSDQHSLASRAQIDFSNVDAIRCITRVLLLDRFGLHVTIPDGSLIPTVTSRLNYILFLEDLLYAFRIINNPPTACITKTNSHSKFFNTSSSSFATTACVGVDIGCGSTCIYGLLGCSLNSYWRMIATESFKPSSEVACENVKHNHLEQQIQVVHTTSFNANKLLSASQFADASTDSVDFVVCNPPFFPTDKVEVDARQRKRKRNSQTLNSTAKRRRSNSEVLESLESDELPSISLSSESICPGGEIKFVQQIISEAQNSAVDRRAKIYSSMLGLKDSVMPVLEFAEDAEASAIITEFCQGRTVRWCVWWSWQYDLNLMPFNEPLTKFRHQKRPVMYRVIDFPHSADEQKADKLLLPSLDAVVERLEEIMAELKLEFCLKCRVYPDSDKPPAHSNNQVSHLSMNGVNACKYFIIDRRERSLKKCRQRAARKQRASASSTASSAVADEIAAAGSSSSNDQTAYEKPLQIFLYIIQNTLDNNHQQELSYACDHLVPADKFLIKVKVVEHGASNSFAVALLDSIVSRMKISQSLSVS